MLAVPSVRFIGGQVDHSVAIEEMSPSDPVWTQVGVHLHFTTSTNDLTASLLSSLGLCSSRPFIAVHLRRGDFVDLGRIQRDPFELYKNGVEQIQRELKIKRSDEGWFGRPPSDLPVVFVSDSQEEEFVRKLQGWGWIYVDHGAFQTRERWGGWMPGVLDSAVLSKAKGFVG